MNCTHADMLIQKGLDGLLTSDERTRLDAHLDHCASCRATWEQHRLLTRTVTDWVRHPIVADDPGDAFTAQVMSQIATRPAPAPVARRYGLSLLIAVCILVLTMFSYWAGPLVSPHLALPSLAPIVSAGNAVSTGEAGRQFSHLPQDALTAWDSLTARPLTLPSWVWSALIAVLALNGAFVWHARRSQTTEIAR